MSDMIKILAASASQEFGERVAAAYGTNLVPVRTQKFSDGEFTVSIEETVRGKEVIIVQSTFPPSDNLLELLMLIDAAKRASAKRIVAVMPFHWVTLWTPGTEGSRALGGAELPRARAAWEALGRAVVARGAAEQPLATTHPEP